MFRLVKCTSFQRRMPFTKKLLHFHSFSDELPELFTSPSNRFQLLRAILDQTDSSISFLYNSSRSTETHSDPLSKFLTYPALSRSILDNPSDFSLPCNTLGDFEHISLPNILLPTAAGIPGAKEEWFIVSHYTPGRSSLQVEIRSSCWRFTNLFGWRITSVPLLEITTLY